MPRGWTRLGEGSYNIVYVSNDGKSVLKIQKGKEKTDTPRRSVRLWNAINSHTPPPARLELTEEGYLGWVCPFVSGEQASDNEMSEALIDIYNNTGRIVVDATAPKNFVRTPPPNSQVLCVDVGMAIQMERRDEIRFTKAIRNKSFVSLDAWEDLSSAYEPFFRKYQTIYPQTVTTVKALIFIKNNRPDIFDVSFLKNKPALITKLANAHDCQDPKNALAHLDQVASQPVVTKRLKPQVIPETPKEIKAGKDILRKQRPLNLDNIKESCKVELQRYIDSRGSFTKITGTFNPSFMTEWFRNEALTLKKVLAARDLMRKIEQTNSLQEIDTALSKKLTAILLASTFASGLETSIARCNAIVETARNNLDNHTTLKLTR